MNVQSIKKAGSVYALSCITSPGGKHRGLAGSVAVLIAESLLMLTKVYNTPLMDCRPQCNICLVELTTSKNFDFSDFPSPWRS